MVGCAQTQSLQGGPAMPGLQGCHSTAGQRCADGVHPIIFGVRPNLHACRLGGNHRAHRSTAVLPQPWQRLPSTGMLFYTPLTVDIQRAGQQGGEVSESWFCASPRHARGSNQLGMTPCGRRFQQRGPIRATERELCSCASTAVACHCQGSTFVSSRGRR